MRHSNGRSLLRTRGFQWSLGVLALVLLAAFTGWRLSKTKDHQDWTPDQKAELVKSVSDWARAERSRQRPQALPLHPTELALFEPYFSREVLESARVRSVAEMPSPSFVADIRHQGRKIFNLSRAAGMALDDTILLRGENIPPGSPARRSVLFHELVHATQYRYFGVDSFFQQYFASLEEVGYSYPDIVFEHQAFELQHRFVTSPGDPFSVDQEVRSTSVD